MRICVLDTETTGLDPATAGVVEYAHAIVDTSTRRVSGHLSRLCSWGPETTIPPEAKAVHHITEEMLRGAPPVEAILASLNWSAVDAFCAHNAVFDKSFVGSLLPSKPWLDTLRLAKHLWPEAPAYGNQVLRYYRGVEPAWPAAVGHAPRMAPHAALYDVCTTAALLLSLLDTFPHVGEARPPWPEDRVLKDAEEYLIWLSARPVLLRVCGFGKHKGKLWSEVPRDYLQWCHKQPDWGEDELHTIRYYLGLST